MACSLRMKPLHQAFAPSLYTKPLHQAFTPSLYTKPLHQAFTPSLYTKPLHQAFTPSLCTKPWPAPISDYGTERFARPIERLARYAEGAARARRARCGRESLQGGDNKTGRRPVAGCARCPTGRERNGDAADRPRRDRVFPAGRPRLARPDQCGATQGGREMIRRSRPAQ